MAVKSHQTKSLLSCPNPEQQDQIAVRSQADLDHAISLVAGNSGAVVKLILTEPTDEGTASGTGSTAR